MTILSAGDLGVEIDYGAGNPPGTLQRLENGDWQDYSPDGEVISAEQWRLNQDKWLPSPGDREYVASLMGRVVEVGRYANWIAPPPIGINRQAIDFEYIRFN